MRHRQDGSLRCEAECSGAPGEVQAANYPATAGIKFDDIRILLPFSACRGNPDVPIHRPDGDCTDRACVQRGACLNRHVVRADGHKFVRPTPTCKQSSRRKRAGEVGEPPAPEGWRRRRVEHGARREVDCRNTRLQVTHKQPCHGCWTACWCLDRCSGGASHRCPWD